MKRSEKFGMYFLLIAAILFIRNDTPTIASAFFFLSGSILFFISELKE